MRVFQIENYEVISLQIFYDVLNFYERSTILLKLFKENLFDLIFVPQTNVEY